MILINDKYFCSSLCLDEHPVRNIKQSIKNEYYCALEFILSRKYKSARVEEYLKLYKRYLVKADSLPDGKECYDNIVNCRYKPWRNKYKLWLICDAALIVMDSSKIKEIIETVKSGISQKQIMDVDKLADILFSEKADIQEAYLIKAKSLIDQYRYNRKFFESDEHRIIVTANMSAGKSTLINSLIGKDVARTAQEVCTGNISNYYNKPYDDFRIHFDNGNITYDMPDDKVKDFEWTTEVSFAVGFKGINNRMYRMCIVDTPGVNSTIKTEHRKIAKQQILDKNYDYIIYVINANKLGTDEEIDYMKWISENAPRDKIIFVLNKLDNFRASEDSIELSIEGVKNDLLNLGFEAPKIYPVSAYYAYLIKKKMQGITLSEDEEDEYLMFRKKFNKREYDLSQFYEEKNADDSPEGQLKKSGFYYLENKLYGGTL